MGKGVHFALITDNDLIRIDHKGEIVDGGRYRLLNHGRGPLTHFHTGDLFPLTPFKPRMLYTQRFMQLVQMLCVLLTHIVCTVVHFVQLVMSLRPFPFTFSSYKVVV